MWQHTFAAAAAAAAVDVDTYGLHVNVVRVNTVKSYDAWKIWAKYLRTMIPRQESV